MYNRSSARYFLILQSFDWLETLNLGLLQAILLIAVQLSASVFLASCFKFRILVVDQKILQNIWNVVQKKDGEDHLDRSCEKWRSVTESQGAEEYPT